MMLDFVLHVIASVQVTLYLHRFFSFPRLVLSGDRRTEAGLSGSVADVVKQPCNTNN